MMMTTGGEGGDGWMEWVGWWLSEGCFYKGELEGGGLGIGKVTMGCQVR
jgi:hypothetical protein